MKINAKPKILTRHSELSHCALERDAINLYFSTIGSVLAVHINYVDSKIKPNRVIETVVVTHGSTRSFEKSEELRKQKHWT